MTYNGAMFFVIGNVARKRSWSHRRRVYEIHCTEMFCRIFVPDPTGADSYPIVTFSWVLLRKGHKDQVATPLRDLFRWCLQDGQRYASQLGYVPLPQPVVQKALTAVNGVSPGGG
jgi:hypothetical protein